MKKVQKIKGRAYTIPAFARLIQRGNFVIAIITPGEAKSEQVRAALLDEPTGNVRYRIEAVRDLGDLLLHRTKMRRTNVPQATPDPSHAEEGARDA